MQTQLTEYTGAWGSGYFSHWFHTRFLCLSFYHVSIYLLCFFFPISFSFPMLAALSQVLSSSVSCLYNGKATSKHTYIHTRTRVTDDTISPQEKLWARTGRKTLENQDTIWHLWSLNDFLLGVGLRPTGKSQKTGRENYIRENVYAAHSAPSLFAPQMSDYSSTLNLWERGGWWREGDSFHH